ncbi:hypothetical protein HN695_00375 [Candidatus Woesearchaeota archaeon]|jgi:hypothetical protein|nr:hypothetical protein [Candidatus Woesearchaeota archaeon]MBT5271790.1 hypothetical protein [Candidatus Woesearchaeota archaeon]MBT7926768.1 hypothetical protein [Candidatus Woesearchaeota archaeon]
MINKRGKKSQITLFMILGLVVLIFVVFLWYFNSLSSGVDVKVTTKSTQQLDALGVSVTSFVNSALEEATVEALINNGVQAGYYELPDNTDPISSIPFLFYYDDAYLIPRNDLEKQLGYSIDAALNAKLFGLQPFAEQGIEVFMDEPDTEIIIARDNVLVETEMLVTITQGSASKVLKKFQLDMPCRLGTIHDLLVEYVPMQTQDMTTICVECLQSLTTEYDLEVQILPLDPETYAFSITDKKAFVNGSNYEFIFMSKFSTFG